MRGLTTTLLLVAVLAGLGGYIYFVENRKPAVSPDAKAKAFDVAADQIEELQIAITDGDTSTLKKIDDRWQLVNPVDARADNSEVNNMASSLASLDVQRVVEEMPADLGQYGLAMPKLEVAFRTKGQTELRRLQIGDKTPTGGDVYVKRPDESRVFLVSSFIEDTFKRSAFDLRDKTLLTFDRDKITALELTNASGTMRFERKGANWTFVQPRRMRADFAAMETTITSLSAVLAQKFVVDSATPAELAQYGLTRPSATASVIMGDTRVGLALGRTDNAETYARDPSQTAVVMVAPTIVEDMNRGPSYFRRKDVFDLRSFSTTHLELTRGTDTLTLDKSIVDDKDVWKTPAGKIVETAKVEDLLNALAGLRVQAFEDPTDPALTSPALIVRANFGANKGDNDMETVTLARSGDSIVASRPDEPGTLKLDGSPLDGLFKAFDALK
jgi:hypothetical protein